MSHESVVIIGAPRSGTNMLRDVLTHLDGVATWPCDEINYIWRHGNVRYPSDEIPADRATPAVSAYIRRQFGKLAAKTGARLVVEKTCANSLRVPFVERVLPQTKFVFIARDGVDVVGSALKRWKARLDPQYLARKARYVPVSDLPYYASKYALNRLHKLVSPDKRLAVWGPRIDGMEAWPDRYDLLQMCALQWRTCIEKADDDLGRYDSARVHRVRYEEFVASPGESLASLVDFLGLTVTADEIEAATSEVSPRSVGLGRSQIEPPQLERIMPLMAPTMRRFGYQD